MKPDNIKNLEEDESDRLRSVKIILAAVIIIISVGITAYIASKYFTKTGFKTTIVYTTENGTVLVERHIQR